VTERFESSLPVATEGDVVLARQTGRTLATKLGFTGSDPMFVATAISEIARNIIVHAHRGQIVLRVLHKDGRSGIEVVATDEGPGIPDIPQAMKEGFSTVKSLGLGLPGARRLMDDFEIASTVGTGTRIVMRKWLKPSASRGRTHITLG